MADNFDNYSMKVQARVDMPSNKDIDAQIRKLEKSISKLKVSGQFDDTALKNLTNQLNSLKATISTANFSPTALTELTNQVNRALQNINIGNINVGNIGNQAQQAGQQIGKLISDSAEQAISNVSSKNIGRYFRIDSSTSNQFRAEMEKLVSEWTNAKGKLTDLNIQTRTSYDKETDANITRLHQATVTYKNELDEVIKKTIAWRQIGTTTNDEGEKKILRGFVEVAGQYSKSLDTATAKTDNFVKKQKEAVANLQNTINQITSRAFDSNASKPITSDASLDKLNTQVANVENAMNNLRNATSTTFDDAKIKVQEEISQLKILEKELRNADNVSTKMKGTDVTSGLAIAKNDLEKFKADAKDFPQITQTIKDLDTAISKVGDASSLNSFNDSLRVARSELAKIKSETNASNRNEKVGINTSGLQSKIADLQKISPEIDKFETEINGAKVTVQSLLSDLSKISTQSDFSVVSAKFNAFTKAAEASGIAIRDFGNVTDSIAKKANEIQLSTDVTKLTTDYQKFGVVSQEVENNLKELKLAQEAVVNAKGTDRLATEIEKYNTKLAETKSSLKELTTTQVSMNQRTSQMTSMQEWMRKNKAATKLVGDQVNKLIEECKTCDAVRFNGIKNEFKDLQVQAGKAGKLGNSLFGGLIEQGKKFVQWIGVTGTVMRGIQISRDMIQDVKDLDDSLLELSKVSDLSASGLEKVTEQAYELGEKVARTGREVIDATTEFKRAGFDMQQSMDMAESAMVMTNVAENITDTADAAGTLISVLKGFNMDASETMTIVDKINQVSNTSPIGFDNIAEGLERTAGTMAQSGNTIDQTIGLITAGYAQLRNVEKVSTGLITLSARLRGVDEEGETIDGLSAKLQEDFGKIGVAIENADGSLRSIYEIAQDYSKVLPTLSDKQKQYYAELAAGYSMINRVSSNVQKCA